MASTFEKWSNREVGRFADGINSRLKALGATREDAPPLTELQAAVVRDMMGGLATMAYNYGRRRAFADRRQRRAKQLDSTP